MSMCSTVQPVSSCPQSRLAAASLGAVLISLIVLVIVAVIVTFTGDSNPAR